MRCRIIVSPAEKRNVTIDRSPPIKSREICTSQELTHPVRRAELGKRTPELLDDSKPFNRI